MIILKRVTVTNNLEKYPEHSVDTLENPNLVPYVEDECESFIVDPRDKGFCCADEFFACHPVSEFVVDEDQLK